jgi:hypothetical protein
VVIRDPVWRGLTACVAGTLLGLCVWGITALLITWVAMGIFGVRHSSATGFDAVFGAAIVAIPVLCLLPLVLYRALSPQESKDLLL